MDRSVTQLLGWYKTHKRDLPWRKTRDAYRIFMSELMLQQTQVDRVLPKYRAWIKTFPTWKALANAKTPELLHAWAGLGYNRRALYAREAAQAVIREGEPTTEAEWRKLKGVGPYMAAALAEFANHQRAVVIDTNVRRVAGRLFLGLPHPHLTDDAQILKTLDRVTPYDGAHWDLPQAFMDLGSSICLPNPSCARCPLQSTCKTSKKFLSGRVEKKKRRPTTERIHRDKKFPDRIYRGRILAIVRENGITKISALGPRIDEGFDPIADTDWVRAMATRLVKDGLLAFGRGDTLKIANS